jgi:hypothetical protein
LTGGEAPPEPFRAPDDDTKSAAKSKGPRGGIPRRDEDADAVFRPGALDTVVGEVGAMLKFTTARTGCPVEVDGGLQIVHELRAWLPGRRWKML